MWNLKTAKALGPPLPWSLLQRADLLIDGQLELRRLLHGKSVGFHTLENLVQVDGRAAVRVRKTRPVGHEATGVPVCVEKGMSGGVA